MSVNQQQLDYLSAMGISVWVSRDLPLPEVRPDLSPSKIDLTHELLVPQALESESTNPVGVNQQRADLPKKESNQALSKKGLKAADQLIRDLQQQPVKQIAELAAELDETVTAEPVVVIKDLEGTDWLALQEAVNACKACDLHEKRQHTVFGKGNQQASVMIVGDIPRLLDEQQGQPFTGEAGELLENMLNHLDLEADTVYFTNLLKCRPPLDNSPQPNQAMSCLSYLKQQITLLRPRLVLLMGRSTAQKTLGKDLSMTQLRQKQHQVQGLDTQFVATYHPAYLLKQPRLKAQVWQDLQFIKQVLTDNG